MPSIALPATRADRRSLSTNAAAPAAPQLHPSNLHQLDGRDRGPWNKDLFRVLEGFSDLAHDDEVDACSGALEMLNPHMKGWGSYEAARRRAKSSRSSASRNPPKSYTPSARWNGSPSRTNPSEPRVPVLRFSTRGIFEWPHVHAAQPGQRGPRIRISPPPPASPGT